MGIKWRVLQIFYKVKEITNLRKQKVVHVLVYQFDQQDNYKNRLIELSC